jgi:hypothetical protein
MVHAFEHVLDAGFPFDAVQMPLNAFDATFRSFQTQVLPELNRRAIAVLAMKPMTGHGIGTLPLHPIVPTAREKRCGRNPRSCFPRE